MKKINIALITLLAATVAFSACEEWEPVYTFKYDEPEPSEVSIPQSNSTIAQLKALYTNAPVDISDDVVIRGQVISSDRSGNIYRSLYIQDETGGLELKIGKSSLYNDYKLGQWITVKCQGLTLGAYNGMLQLGFKDPTGDYETAYIDVQLIIDQHIFKGEIGTPLEPEVLDETALRAALSQGGSSPAFGKYVTLRGLTYGATSSYSTDSYKRIFCLVYVDQAKDTKENTNRVFLSDKTYGVTTWAMSKSLFIRHLDDGWFDTADTGDGIVITNKRNESDPETIKQTIRRNANSMTVSQYFSLGSTPVQIRTSGYSKFADTEIPAEVIGDPGSSTADGKSIDVTGILTIYQGNAQFTLIDLDGVKVND